MTNSIIMQNDEELTQELIKNQLSFLNHHRKQNKLKKSLLNSKVAVLRHILRSMDEGLYKTLDDVKTHCETLMDFSKQKKDEVTASNKIICSKIENQRRLLEEYKTQSEEEESA